MNENMMNIRETLTNTNVMEEKAMNKQNLLTLEQMAYELGVSFKTINNWYSYKKKNPESELASLLPDFIQSGARQTRYWKCEDIEAMRKFQAAIPKGRKGVMGNVTQCYIKGGIHHKESQTVIKRKALMKEIYDILDNSNVDGETIGAVMAVLLTA